MKRLLWIPVLMSLLGCEDAATFTWTARQYEGPACGDCPEISIAIPEGPEDNRLAQTVRRSLTEEIIYWLDYAEENTATTIAEAMASFGAGYRELKERYPDETVGWEARIEGLVRYESPSILSISLDGYIFTGGAHGYSGRKFLNFDVEEARELGNKELFSDTAAFRQLAEHEFRMAWDIPAGEGINSTGFMFEESRFHLPENIGFTPEGLLLFYNPYEVASYAEGPIELVIAYEKAAPYLSEQLMPIGAGPGPAQ